MDTAFVKITDNTNKILLIAVDSLSKWVEADFVEDTKASTAALFVIKYIISRVQEPATIVTDGGPEFRNNFENFLANVGVKQIRTAPHTPEMNGLAERFVKTIKEGVEKMMRDGVDGQWALQVVLRTLRWTENDTTKVVPAELVLHPVITKREFNDPKIKEAQDNIERRSQYVKQRLQNEAEVETCDYVFGDGATTAQIWKVTRQRGNKLRVFDGFRHMELPSSRVRKVNKRRGLLWEARKNKMSGRHLFLGGSINRSQL